MDAAVAFLNGILIDRVYMRQPYGSEKGEGLAWRLKKSIYGLTLAVSIWYDTLFRTCSYDAELFIHQTRQNLYTTTHVDDFQLVAASEDIQWAVDSLPTKYEMKDISNMTY